MDYADVVWMQFLINLTKYIDKRVAFHGGHSAQVATWARITARQFEFGEDDIHSIFWAAMLHDVGKIGVPDHILSKNGPLTNNEWSMMKLHPIIGANIVNSLNGISHIAPIIYYHQERYDGSGYPQGLRGEEIPLPARIVCVVDAYEAMISDRVYRQARSHYEAVSELQRMGGVQFDPWVVEKFICVVSETRPRHNLLNQ